MFSVRLRVITTTQKFTLICDSGSSPKWVAPESRFQQWIQRNHVLLSIPCDAVTKSSDFPRGMRLGASRDDRPVRHVSAFPGGRKEKAYGQQRHFAREQPRRGNPPHNEAPCRRPQRHPYNSSGAGLASAPTLTCFSLPVWLQPFHCYKLPAPLYYQPLIRRKCPADVINLVYIHFSHNLVPKMPSSFLLSVLRRKAIGLR